jgi:hypothetical protein
MNVRVTDIYIYIRGNRPNANSGCSVATSCFVLLCFTHVICFLFRLLKLYVTNVCQCPAAVPPTTQGRKNETKYGSTIIYYRYKGKQILVNDHGVATARAHGLGCGLQKRRHTVNVVFMKAWKTQQRVLKLEELLAN